MRRRYEVWFVRCGMADGSGAWWFRYLLVNNIKISPEMPARRHFQVWATWFPRGTVPQSFIVEIPLEQLDLSTRGHVPFHCRASESGIEEGRCWGNLRPDGHHISWNIRIHSRFAAKLSDKGWIGFFPLAAFRRRLLRRDYFRREKIQRRTAGIRRTGAQLRIPPPQLLALDARLFPETRRRQHAGSAGVRLAARDGLSKWNSMASRQANESSENKRIEDCADQRASAMDFFWPAG